MKWALVVMALLAAPAVQAKDTQFEGVCETLRQMAELASDAATAARAASDLGKDGLAGLASDHLLATDASIATARASTLAREAADLTRSLVHSSEEMCPRALEPT